MCVSHEGLEQKRPLSCQGRWVAKRWTGMGGGGANRKTHKLILLPLILRSNGKVPLRLVHSVNKGSLKGRKVYFELYKTKADLLLIHSATQ